MMNWLLSVFDKICDLINYFIPGGRHRKVCIPIKIALIIIIVGSFYGAYRIVVPPPSSPITISGVYKGYPKDYLGENQFVLLKITELSYEKTICKISVSVKNGFKRTCSEGHFDAEKLDIFIADLGRGNIIEAPDGKFELHFLVGGEKVVFKYKRKEG